jgi:uncharacterized ubiquitin-like protein YukD
MLAFFIYEDDYFYKYFDLKISVHIKVKITCSEALNSFHIKIFKNLLPDIKTGY